MKKVISMILALVMAFAFGISALAEEGSQSLDEALGSAKSVTVPMKTDYTLGSEKLIHFISKSALWQRNVQHTDTSLKAPFSNE